MPHTVKHDSLKGSFYSEADDNRLGIITDLGNFVMISLRPAKI